MAVRGEEPDDNTLDNAGPVGIELADTLKEKMVEVITGFPGSGPQKIAIARLLANGLYDWIEENE
jgi:hypothetical protein